MEGAAERNRRPVAVTREISSPAADVWAAISQPGNLAWNALFAMSDYKDDDPYLFDTTGKYYLGQAGLIYSF